MQILPCLIKVQITPYCQHRGNLWMDGGTISRKQNLEEAHPGQMVQVTI